MRHEGVRARRCELMSSVMVRAGVRAGGAGQGAGGRGLPCAGLHVRRRAVPCCMFDYES